MTLAAQTRASAALLIVDAISDFAFEGGDALLPHAKTAAPRIARLRKRLKAAGVPIIYANDNLGRWQSDFRQLLALCAGDGSPGAEIARLLEPQSDDYFVLKPRHSPFFATPLALLLQHLGCDTLVVSGFAGDGCVLAAAADAHMRDYRVFVPSDCTASETPARNRRALLLMQKAMRVDTRQSPRLSARMLGA